MSAPRHGLRSKRAILAAVAVLVFALVGASFALAQGPIYTFLGKAGKPASATAKAKGRQGAISKASRVINRRIRQPRDTTAPETTITGAPGNGTATSASFGFTASEAGSTFACKLDSGRWSACLSPRLYSGLSLGSHTFSVRATDIAGNTDSTPAARTWAVETVPAPAPVPPPVETTPPSPPADTTAPETTITGAPGNGTATSASFGFTASEAGSTFACKLDSGNWMACSSPSSYSSLNIGTHAFSVRATDIAGNTDATPATQTWTIETLPPPPPPADTTAPDTSITDGPVAATTATMASFSMAATEPGSSFACRLDGSSWVACSSPRNYSSLSIGSHAFSVRATDIAGNTDASPATQTWTVEAPPTEPPPPTSNCTTTASSISALTSALSSAAPGSVLCLADGSYSKLTLSASKAAPGVTVRAANPAGATIAGASLAGSNLTLARFVITNGVQVMPGASGMTIDHNRITGGGQGIDMPTSSTMVNDTKIVGNKLIGPFGEDAIHLNRYHDANGDGIGVLIEGNEITNVRENGNHSDCLQTVWVGDHIVFRKNYLHDNRCQGFFIKDQASLGNPSGPVEGITVDNNLFVRNQEPCGPPLTSCGQPNYFQVFGPYSGFRMTRNTIWGDGGDSVAALRGGTSPDTVIANNVVYKLWTDTNMTATSVTNNTVCILEAGSGGSWPSSRPGETKSCSLSFQNAASDDYRISGSDRGVDWAPAQQQYGP